MGKMGQFANFRSANKRRLVALCLTSVFSLNAAKTDMAQALAADPPLQTEYSRRIAAFEAKANSAGSDQLIYIIDRDRLDLSSHGHDWSLMLGIDAELERRGVKLADRNVSELSVKAGWYDPQRTGAVSMRYEKARGEIDPSSSVSKLCVIIPSFHDLSSVQLYDQRLGQIPPSRLISKQVPAPYVVSDGIDWHEIWHCLDDRFVPLKYTIDKNKGPEYGYNSHKAEISAEVAGILTMAVLGNSEFPRQQGDIRAVWSRGYGPELTRIWKDDPDESRYRGSIYFVSRALDLVPDYAKKLGAPKTLDQIDLEQIRQAAHEIVEKAGLSQLEFTALDQYLEKGEAYLQSLEAKARQGNEESRAQSEFLKYYKQRTDEARARMATDTGAPVPRLKQNDSGAPAVQDILKGATVQEKDEIRQRVRDVQMSPGAARDSGKTALVQVIDQWRAELNEDAGGRRPDLSRKLLLIGLMIRFGEFENASAHQHQPEKFAAPKPSG